MEPVEKQLRCLCLHGFGANARVMAFQIRQWITLFPYINFEMMEGRFSIETFNFRDDSLKKLMGPGEKGYSHLSKVDLTYDKEIPDFKMEELEPYIERIRTAEPAFNMILCFSQGSIIAHDLFHIRNMLHEKKLQKNFEGRINLEDSDKFQAIKLGIFFCAPPPRRPVVIPGIRVVFIMNTDDRVIPIYVFGVSMVYKNSGIILGEGGHKIPLMSTENVMTIVQEFKNAFPGKDIPPGPSMSLPKPLL
jgi:Serine hydrolase (FSH1)